MQLWKKTKTKKTNFYSYSKLGTNDEIFPIMGIFSSYDFQEISPLICSPIPISPQTSNWPIFQFVLVILLWLYKYMNKS